MKKIVDHFKKDIKRRLRGYLDKQTQQNKKSKTASSEESKSEDVEIKVTKVEINLKDSTQWIKKVFFISRKYTVNQVLFRDTIKAMLAVQGLFHRHEEDKASLKNETQALTDAASAVQACQAQFNDLAKSGSDLEGIGKDASIIADLLGRELRWLSYLQELAGAEGGVA